MDNLVNQPFLTKRGKYARWGSYLGLGALFIGLFITAQYPLLAYLLLLIGLVGASFGSYMANRYVREPRADQVLADVLGNLDKRHTLYNYYLGSNHVLASHYGLTVLLPRAQEGQVTYQGGRWNHKRGWRRLLQLFGEPGLGKPDQDLKQEIEWLKKWIDEVMPGANIPVNGAVVFTSPKVELRVSEPLVPVMLASELEDFIKQGLKGQPTLSTATQKELRRTLDEVVAAQS